MRLKRSLCRLGYCNAIEVRFDFVNMHDVNIFVRKIKQVRLKRDVGSIENALFHDRDVKSCGLGVDNPSTEASGGRASSDNQTPYTQRIQLGQQGCSIEATRPRLVDHHVAQRRGERRKNIIIVRLTLTLAAVGYLTAAWPFCGLLKGRSSPVE